MAPHLTSSARLVPTCRPLLSQALYKHGSYRTPCPADTTGHVLVRRDLAVRARRSPGIAEEIAHCCSAAIQQPTSARWRRVKRSNRTSSTSEEGWRPRACFVGRLQKDGADPALRPAGPRCRGAALASRSQHAGPEPRESATQTGSPPLPFRLIGPGQRLSPVRRCPGRRARWQGAEDQRVLRNRDRDVLRRSSAASLPCPVLR